MCKSQCLASHVPKAIIRRGKLGSIPEQITLREQPADIEPRWVAQLLQFFVVDGDIGHAIISYRSGRGPSAISDVARLYFVSREQKVTHGADQASARRKVGDIRERSVVLDLVLEPCQLLDDLLALLCPLGLGSLGGGAVGVVDGLRLGGAGIGSVRSSSESRRADI